MTYLRCPSGLDVEMRTLLGKDLRTIAASKKSKRQLEIFAETMRGATAKVLDPGPYSFVKEGATFDWMRVAQGDFMVALLNMHIETYGHEIKQTYECGCGFKGEFWIDLRTFTVKPIPEKSLDAMRRNDAPIEATLFDGRRIKFRLPTLALNRVIEEQHRQMRKRPEWADHARTDIDQIAAQLTEVEGVEDSNDFVARLEWLLSLPAGYLYALTDLMMEANGGIDTEIGHPCSACGAEIRGDLPLDSVLDPSLRKRPSASSPETSGSTASSQDSQASGPSTPIESSRPG